MVLSRIRITDDLSDRIRDRLVLLAQNPREYLALHGDSQRLTDLVKEVIQLLLLGHRALHL